MQVAKQFLVEAWELIPYPIALLIITLNIPQIIYGRSSTPSLPEAVSKFPSIALQRKSFPSFSPQSIPIATVSLAL